MAKNSHNLSGFELAVLERLKEVPRGRVTTYGELARAVGRPRAARAVGNALNKNPWAPRVPCHRVVTGDGRLGGYGGGPARKIALLKAERVAVKAGRITAFSEKFYRFA